MIISKFYDLMPGVFSPPLYRNGHSIYPEKEFEKLINREKARVDRGGNGFSVVVFDQTKQTEYNNDRLYSILIKQISQRVRLTDEIGWFDKGSLAVLLVDTTVKNARKVAHEVCQSVDQGSSFVKYRVLNYPSSIFRENGSDKEPVEFPVIEGNMENEYGAEYTRCTEQESIDMLLIPRFPVWKRAIDIVGALAIILIVFPLCLLVAIIIRIVSPGPVFFKQKRMGFMGREFTIWKFRTMEIEADCETHRDYVGDLIKKNKPMTKLDCVDDQIIPYVGKLLRVSCIDELPQLINVLRGEMSLVGPRPCIKYEFNQYLPWHKSRVLSVPGITGLWQVSGKNNTTFRKMIELDITYERQKSLWLDLKILIKTIGVIFDQAFNLIFIVKEERSNATQI